MPREMSMPIAQDVAASAGGGGYQREASVIYTPLPSGQNATGVGMNKLFFTIFNPSLWALHRPTPETDPLGLRYGHSVAAPDGSGAMITPDQATPPDLWTFYWKIFGHYIEMVTSSGQKRTQYVMCPAGYNKYLVDVLKYKPLFKDARCRYCDESQAWWAAFDAHWPNAKEPSGAPVNKDRWSYGDKRDLYNAIMKHNPVLEQIRTEAGKWTTGPRWIFEVFDISKMRGERPMDQNEEQVDYQLYFAPKSVFDGLNELYSAGVKFFDLDTPGLIMLTKDCTEGARNAKYRLQNLGPLTLTPEEKAFLESEQSLRDLQPGQLGQDGSILYILSYDEQSKLANLPDKPNVQQLQSAPQAGPSTIQAPTPTQVPAVSSPPPIQPVQVPVGLKPQGLAGAPIVAPPPTGGHPTAPTPPIVGAAPSNKPRGKNTW
jgi:hypothetical protein